MNNYKHKSKIAFLCLFLMAFVFSAIPTPSWALFGMEIGLETLPYPDEDDHPCNLSEYQSEASNGKWWKTPLQAVIDASVAVGNQTYSSVGPSACGVVGAGVALWLAVFMLKFLGGMSAPDLPQALTEIGGQLLRAAFAVVLLRNTNFFFGYFFAPVIEAGAGFVNANGLGVGGGAPDISVSGGLAGAGQALMGMADTVHETIGAISAMGSYTFCLSKIHKLSIITEILTFWDPGLIAMGCAMKVGAWIFMAFFPFFLIDACFRMGVVAALCPLFVSAWVFKSTRQYATKGFQAVLNVAFVFMMVKIAAMIAIHLLAEASGSGDLLGSSSASQADMTKIVCKNRYLYFGDGAPCEGENAGHSSILVFFLCVAYGILLLEKGSGELANNFSGISFSNDAAIKAAKTVANPVIKGARNVAKKAVRGVADRVGNSIKDRRAAREVDKYNSKVEAARKSGVEFKPSEREQARYEKSKARLQERGYMRKDGSQTMNFGKLLSRSRREAYNERGGALTAGSDRLAAVQAQEKKMETNQYHYRGESTAVGRALGHTQLGRSMGFGQLKRETTQNSDGTVSQTQYRHNGNIKQRTQAGTNGTTVEKFRRDGTRESTEQKIDGSVSRTRFNKDGTPMAIRTTNPDGSKSITAFRKDENGRTVSDTKTKDSHGNVTSTSYAQYDDKMRMTENVSNNPADGSTSTTKYNYDNGQITSSTVTNDKDGNITSTMQAKHDSNGQITESTTKNADGSVTETEYENGQPKLSHTQSANGAYTVTEYEGGKAVSSTTENPDGSVVKSEMNYNKKGEYEGRTSTRFENGKVISQEKENADGSLNEKATMNYDSKGDYAGQKIERFRNGKSVGSRDYDAKGIEKGAATARRPTHF